MVGWFVCHRAHSTETYLRELDDRQAPLSLARRSSSVVVRRAIGGRQSVLPILLFVIIIVLLLIYFFFSNNSSQLFGSQVSQYSDSREGRVAVGVVHGSPEKSTVSSSSSSSTIVRSFAVSS